MRASAPGKIVLSGSYSVLDGAPALVAAVDRRAVADTETKPSHDSPEVQAAVELGAIDAPCGFDVTALRTPIGTGTETRKIGLGSSAAILVAVIAARWAAAGRDIDEARDELFDAALAAHQQAQQGGSGVDIAAATYGGVLVYEVGVAPQRHSLVEGVVIEIWASEEAAITRELIASVREVEQAEPGTYRSLMERAKGAATEAVRASDVADFVAALVEQRDALDELSGHARRLTPSAPPIVTAAMRRLGSGCPPGSFFGPSGAGGGDIALFIGPEASPPSWRSAAAREHFVHIPMVLGVDGATLVPTR